MFEVNVSMFYEEEDRRYDDFFLMGYFPTHQAAVNFAKALVIRCRHELEAMLGADPNGGGWDGLSVDVREVTDPPGCFDTSYDVVPGRAIGVWHAEECHE